ncbi:MAG: 3'(2'),5'-bisphosphate nucleotidase CysQ [Acidimicrobiia bacterium]|nr:3'(2'),5'-bisphosphate nucleotidase CysQ [Acidimicrobiia bacterium]
MPTAGTAPDTPDDRAGASEEDHRLATKLATRAGVLLIELRREYGFDVSNEASGAGPAVADALRAQGDRLAHEFLAGALAEARPGDAVLSEEAPDDHRRLHADRVWIVDPLDGTRQFGEAGRSDWAVHVALVIGGVPVAGAVALPAEGITLSTADPHLLPSLPPATSEGRAGRRRRVIASRSRPGSDARVVAAALDAELVALGSVGAKVAQVIRGRVDAYVHSGGQSEWDSAAPVAVALACGLHASRLDGRPLRYNQPDVELPDLLICRPEIAEAALAAAAHLGTPSSRPG